MCMLKSSIWKSILLIAFVSIALTSNCEAESSTVYGFWPEYIDPSTYQPDWTLLTHVAYSSWGVNNDGSLTPPKDIGRYYAVRDSAHQHGVKVIISVSSGDQHTIDNIIANHREDFANNVLDTMQTYGADGVNLDFEFPLEPNSVTKTSNMILFEDFMKTLNATLKSSNPQYHISIDTSSVVEGTYRNRNLSQYMDSIFLMGYEYNWRTEATGPNSPFDDPTRHDVKDSVEILLQYYDPQKITVGVPFYGYVWQADSGQPGTKLTGNDHTAIDMKLAIDNAKKYGRLWDSNSHTPWYRYFSGGKWYQAWYDDEESIRLKYEYVKSQNLGGIGFWALGWEGNYPDIWKVF